jgi:P4 family phage/plasmid primase-like protien
MTIESPGTPEPIKLDLLGLQSLVKFPNARAILVHGQDDYAAAQRMFPQNPVLAWEGGTGALHTYYLGHLETRPTIIWDNLPVAPVLKELERQLAVAGINGGSQIALFAPDNPMECYGVAEAEKHRLNRQWIVPRLRPYVPVAAPEPAATTPAAAVEPVARPVAAASGLAPEQRSASVTPITEARVKQQAKAQDDPIEYAEFAEDALANGFSERHPELRYVARWGKWMEWTDAEGWAEDNTLHIYDLTRTHCRLAAMGNPNASLTTVRKVKSAATRASIENLARSDRRHAITADVWDADKLALNTPGGLVDLRDGSMRPARVDDYCRKRTAATPGGVCPQWDAFLDQCTDGDSAMQSYLARIAGMACTGDTREDFLGFIYGPGGNGKSVFIDTIQNILGSYAINAGIETFTEQKSDKHTTELARLYGARLVVAQETEQGRRWAESRLKLLTGGGKVTARFMRCDDFEFTPELKLIIVGNHKPSLRNVDAAFRRRFHLIPFTHVPATVDRTLRQKLWAERDGILLWIIAGCADWLAGGLRAPESVTSATSEYFDTQDIVGQWIADMCEPGESTIRSLFDSYRKYCEGLHEFALRQGELRDALLCRPGITQGGYAKSPVIKGLRVRVDTSAHDARYPDN